jgi:hypothetical protein
MKSLHELFEMPNDSVEESNNTEHNIFGEGSEFLDEYELASSIGENALEKIESALPRVRSLEASDKELDEIAQLAKDTCIELIDLGSQVEGKYSAEIFNSASSFLGHSLTAKTAKINKKLKMIQLQLQKAELDRKIKSAEKQSPESQKEKEGQNTYMDRSELLREILQQSKTASIN